MMSDTNYRANLMVAWIEAFEAQCEENNYMDTGDVSALLHDLKANLKELAKGG